MIRPPKSRRTKSAQQMGDRLPEVVDSMGQAQPDRREFLVQAAAFAFAASGPLCCGCQKTPSGSDGAPPSAASRPLSAEEQGSGSGQKSAGSVEQRVIEIVAEQMGIARERVKRESRFKEDLGADSLDTVELVMELEEEFDINIPDDVAEKTRTVGQAVECVAKLLGNRSVPPRKRGRKAQPSKPATR